jgi:hypothetical protein
VKGTKVDYKAGRSLKLIGRSVTTSEDKPVDELAQFAHRECCSQLSPTSDLAATVLCFKYQPACRDTFIIHLKFRSCREGIFYRIPQLLGAPHPIWPQLAPSSSVQKPAHTETACTVADSGTHLINGDALLLLAGRFTLPIQFNRLIL